MNPEVKKGFSWKPIISLMRGRKINSFLVMLKSYHIDKSAGPLVANSAKFAKMSIKLKSLLLHLQKARVRGKGCMQQHVSQQLQSFIETGSIEDVCITLIDEHRPLDSF